MEYSDLVGRVARRLAQSKRILFITGAGMSADSGLPTYRGVGGLYHDRHTEDGMPVEEALAGHTLALRPEITWKYLLEIAHNCRGASPNAGHRAIAGLEASQEVVVLTQNIDGFHQHAGSTKVIDIHNGMERLFCMDCGKSAQLNLEDIGQLPPRCACGGVIRPDVVLFGEMLPVAKLERLEAELDKGFDLVFSVGTTSVFAYISRPVLALGSRGAVTVEINPGDTCISDVVDVKLAEKATKALEDILRFRP
jgi:NAD-dependent deacetylase